MPAERCRKPIRVSADVEGGALAVRLRRRADDAAVDHGTARPVEGSRDPGHRGGADRIGVDEDGLRRGTSKERCEPLRRRQGRAWRHDRQNQLGLGDGVERYLGHAGLRGASPRRLATPLERRQHPGAALDQAKTDAASHGTRNQDRDGGHDPASARTPKLTPVNCSEISHSRRATSSSRACGITRDGPTAPDRSPRPIGP